MAIIFLWRKYYSFCLTKAVFMDISRKILIIIIIITTLIKSYTQLETTTTLKKTKIKINTKHKNTRTSTQDFKRANELRIKILKTQLNCFAWNVQHPI